MFHIIWYNYNMKKIHDKYEIFHHCNGEKIVENDKFVNKKFVVTGTLDKFGRDEVKNIIENNGGVTSGSVSKKTDVVIVGRDPGSKYEKAVSFGIEIWDEEKFINKLKND